MDTDSSLPPLLLLVASLLTFVWANVVVATRRRRPGLVELLGYSPSPVIGILRILSAAVAGVASIALGMALSSGPVLLLLVVSAASIAAALSVVYAIAVWWSSAFPRAARMVAYPRRWMPNPGTPAVNGNVAGENGTNGLGGQFDNPEGGDQFELTPADILNLDQNDMVMVRSISMMDDRDAQDIMIPRLDMDAVAGSASLEELVETFISTRHTRLPVYGDTLDNVVGIVHISDVLPALARGNNGAGLKDLMRQPEFVAENMAVDDLLHLMRSKSLQMVIVVDEYGGVEGLVTLEDVLEVIVGDIEDEFGVPEPELTSASEPDGSWLVRASTPLDEVNRVPGIKIGDQEVHTIGGYVYTQLGRMPTVGDVVSNGQMSIEVTQVRGRRIQQLRLIPAAPADDDREREATAK